MGTRSGAGVRLLSLGHGFFWIVTGLWPLSHRPSFEAVVGPKVDYWLAECVGLLIAVIGAVLLLAGRRGRLTPELLFLAIAAPFALGANETYYALIGRIPPIYLADAVVEAGLIVGWIAVASRRHRRQSSDSLRPRQPGG